MKNTEILIKATPKKPKSDQKITISMQGRLTMMNMENIANDLVKKIDQSSEMEIILEKVEDIDLAFLQMLFSAIRYSKKKKKELQINASLNEDFWKLMKNAGLPEDFNNINHKI